MNNEIIEIDKMCSYGCGLKANYILNNNKLCCSQYYSQCPAIKKKNSLGNLGKKRPEGTGLKISKALKGRKYGEEFRRKVRENHAHLKGEKHPFFGKHHSDETKRKISEKSRGRKHSEKTKKKISLSMEGEKNPMFGRSRPEMTGCNNPRWKGGVSKSPYCKVFLNKQFREIILGRDNKRCLNPVCSNKSKRIVIHHIDYNKHNCSLFNLLCLCNQCNASANKDREWHKFWYEAIIYQRYIKRKI